MNFEPKQYNISIEAGADFYWKFVVRDAENYLVDLTDTEISCQLRQTPESQDYFQMTALHNGAGGTVVLTMPHEQTAQIGYTAGYYDVFITWPDASVQKYLWGEAAIQTNVTKPIDGAIMYLLSFASEDAFPAEGMTGRVYLSFLTGMIYRWNGTAYIGITTLAPSAWGTITGEITEQEDLQDALSEKADVTDVETALEEKSDTDHIHDDRYYTETEVDEMIANLDPDYQLIESITLEEDVSEIVRETDTTGRAYNFSKLLVMIVFQPRSSSSDYHVYCGSSNNDRVCYLRNITTVNYAVVKMEINNGRLYVSQANSAYRWNNSVAYGTVLGGGWLEKSAIDYFGLRNASYDLVAGTTIDIYGVWKE